MQLIPVEPANKTNTILVPRIRGFWFPKHLEHLIKLMPPPLYTHLSQSLHGVNHAQLSRIPENLVYYLNMSEMTVFANHYKGIADAPNAEIQSVMFTKDGVNYPNMQMSLVWTAEGPPKESEQVLIDYGYELQPDSREVLEARSTKLNRQYHRMAKGKSTEANSDTENSPVKPLEPKKKYRRVPDSSEHSSDYPDSEDEPVNKKRKRIPKKSKAQTPASSKKAVQESSKRQKAKTASLSDAIVVVPQAGAMPHLP